MATTLHPDPQPPAATPLPPHSLSGLPVIVGGGLAGLMTAVELAPTPCVLVTGGVLGDDCASDWAQGGLAAAVGPDDDPQLHAADTIAAGAGLCDPAVVARITAAGPAAVQRLLDLGADLDREPDGTLRLGLEGAHRRRRIVHADGDGSGHELTRTAVAAVRRTPSVTVLERTYAVHLTTGAHGQITGIVLADGEGLSVLSTDRVVLATGGLGSLFAHTTNPGGSRGSGLALGLRAGAVVRDLELVQFHPTALDVGIDPMPLVSEAVRGEGAHLVTVGGERILDDDLAARDVVSRAVWARLEQGEAVFLDARDSIGPAFPEHFPTVTAGCRDAGIDPVTDLIPVRPAAHYHMGGLLVDEECRTTVPGLWAVGEVSSTGLHGANRLASNSLLEAVVCASWVARSVAAADGHVLGVRADDPLAAASPVPAAQTAGAFGAVASRGPHPAELALSPESPPWTPDPQARFILSQAAGVLREHRSLTRATQLLRDGALDNDARLVSLLLCVAALRRTESRGGHTRTDYPDQYAPAHTLLTLSEALATLDAPTATDRSA